MTKIKMEEGQEVYVSTSGGWVGKSEPNLRKFIVVRANKTSFYANPEGVEDKSPYRFNQKDLSHNTGWGYHYQAYRTEKEYWDMIERGKEKAQLRKELKDTVDKMSLIELRKLKEVLFVTK
ncbi:hypothetical protein V4C29_24065 [Bacillus cereus]|jgi:hypothetical protein|uniref:beta barrel domain-containing protein n=1 Tax=Bacillus cereus TaxID=1396 RepID=UPI002FE4F6D0